MDCLSWIAIIMDRRGTKKDLPESEHVCRANNHWCKSWANHAQHNSVTLLIYVEDDAGNAGIAPWGNFNAWGGEEPLPL